MSVTSPAHQPIALAIAQPRPSTARYMTIALTIMFAPTLLAAISFLARH